MKLLLVEDDSYLSGAMKSGLEESGYAVDNVTSGPDALDLAGLYAYDLIILDIMLPGMDGFSVCRELRNRHIVTPILILTARYQEDDRVRGLDSGADDYLVKPFGYPELYARIRALLRRGNNIVSTEIRIGELIMDTVRRSITYGGKDIDLTGREYAILEYLVVNRNCVVTRDMIEQHVWDSEYGAFSNVVEVLISRIRRKLCPDNREAVIRTVKGLGYVVKE